MKKMLVATSLFTLLALGAETAAQATPSVQKTKETATTSRGLWLEFSIGSSVGFSHSVLVLGTWPGVMIGYKTGRLVVGAQVGAGFSGYRSDSSEYGFDQRSRGFSVVPRLTYDVIQRGPFALFLAAGVGYSMSWTEYSNTDVEDRVSQGLVAHLGFGVRYFIHPRFAIAVEVTADGRYVRERQEGTPVAPAATSWDVKLRGALSAAVVF